MTILDTDIDIYSEQFAGNAEHMETYVQKVRAIEQKQIENEEKYRERAEKKGKLLPRERLSLLLDPGSPFVELCSIAGYRMYDDKDGSTSGGSLIAGIGFVSERRCMVIVWNYAIKGGTLNSITVKKLLRLQEICFEQKLPTVSLHESGGGNLDSAAAAMDPWAANLFLDAGRVYGQQAELSAQGLPQITVSHGNATAGGAYSVALSDYIVLVNGKTQLFLAGPPLLAAGTGEIANAEELGGAEMHARISGTGEYMAADDADGIRIAREIMANLPRDPKIEPNKKHFVPPVHQPEELLGVVPTDKKVPYKVHEILARIADGSEFFEFNSEVDQQTICGHIHIFGQKIGIIGNNGPITPKGAVKAAQFIQLCDQAFTPLLFLQNTTGFMVGVETEQAGQVKHSAKLIQAVANAKGPKLTILVGNAYGAGNYAMASKALKPDFVFAWPSARQAVMGGAQAAKVMTIVTEGKMQAKGLEMDEKARAGIESKAQMIEMGLEILSESMYCSARMMDDGIIDPRDTRKLIHFLLQTCQEARHKKVQKTSYGVARL